MVTIFLRLFFMLWTIYVFDTHGHGQWFLIPIILAYVEGRRKTSCLMKLLFLVSFWTGIGLMFHIGVPWGCLLIIFCMVKVTDYNGII